MPPSKWLQTQPLIATLPHSAEQPHDIRCIAFIHPKRPADSVVLHTQQFQAASVDGSVPWTHTAYRPSSSPQSTDESPWAVVNAVDIFAGSRPLDAIAAAKVTYLWAKMVLLEPLAHDGVFDDLYVLKSMCKHFNAADVIELFPVATNQSPLEIAQHRAELYLEALKRTSKALKISRGRQSKGDVVAASASGSSFASSSSSPSPSLNTRTLTGKK